MDPVAEWMIQTYDAQAEGYRAEDERHVTGHAHQELCKTLGKICSQFERPITVLDLGCGTGRHFHCFKNVYRLIGVDVSPEMLRCARNPVKSSELEIEQIELLCADFFSLTFPEDTFDLITSFGVFGNGCSLSLELMSRMHQWLTPQGVLMLDTADLSKLPPLVRFRKMLNWNIYKRSPRKLQKAWIQRSKWPPAFYCTFKTLHVLARSAGFLRFSIDRKSSTFHDKIATKLVLTASKSPEPCASPSLTQQRS